MSIHTLVEPDAALARRSFLEDVARAGDFAVYRDRERGPGVDGAERLGRRARRPGAAGRLHRADRRCCTATGRRGCPSCATRSRATATCGPPRTRRSTRARRRSAGGAVTVTEQPDVDLAIVDVPADAPDAGGHRFGGDWVAGLHPMAVHNATERLVVATVAAGATTSSCATSRGCSCARARCACAATSRRWPPGSRTRSAATPCGRPRRSAASCPASPAVPATARSSAARFVALLVDHLATAPPAWDPFSPTPTFLTRLRRAERDEVVSESSVVLR